MGCGVHKSHCVLQLVAESECTARLIYGPASPHPANYGLIQQPAVGHHVERRIWCFHIGRTKQAIPLPPDPAQGFLRCLRSFKPHGKFSAFILGFPDSKPECNNPLLASGESERNLNNGTRV